MKLRGHVIKLGDDINTDLIISGRYTKTLDFKEMSRHVFEDLCKNLYRRMEGSIIVTGENFGLGSSREEAPVAIKEAGGIAIVAPSYGRIFFRNSINIGLPALTADTSRIVDGDELEIFVQEGKLINHTQSFELDLEPLPPLMTCILKSSGLVKHLQRQYELKILNNECAEFKQL